MVLHAMHQMKTARMTHAAGTNEASQALYEACSFAPWYLIDGYVKAIPAQRKDRTLDPASS